MRCDIFYTMSGPNMIGEEEVNKVVDEVANVDEVVNEDTDSNEDDENSEEERDLDELYSLLGKVINGEKFKDGNIVNKCENNKIDTLLKLNIKLYKLNLKILANFGTSGEGKPIEFFDNEVNYLHTTYQDILLDYHGDDEEIEQTVHEFKQELDYYSDYFGEDRSDEEGGEGSGGEEGGEEGF